MVGALRPNRKDKRRDMKKKYDREKTQNDLRAAIAYYKGLIKQLQGYVGAFERLDKQIEKMKEYDPIK